MDTFCPQLLHCLHCRGRCKGSLHRRGRSMWSLHRRGCSMGSLHRRGCSMGSLNGRGRCIRTCLVRIELRRSSLVLPALNPTFPLKNLFTDPCSFHSPTEPAFYSEFQQLSLPLPKETSLQRAVQQWRTPAAHRPCLFNPCFNYTNGRSLHCACSKYPSATVKVLYCA